MWRDVLLVLLSELLCPSSIEREPVRRSLQDGRKHSRVGWLSDVTKKRLT